MEGIEQHRKGVVLPQLGGVAAHLVGDPAIRPALPAPRGHVDVIVIEQHPRLGAFGRRLAFVRLLLEEVADRLVRRVDLLVEPPVDADPAGRGDRPDGDAAGAVAGDDGSGALSGGGHEGGIRSKDREHGRQQQGAHRRAMLPPDTCILQVTWAAAASPATLTSVPAASSRPRRSRCPVACTLDLLGDRWTLLVVRDLVRGKRRFAQFLESSERIPTNILADRLKRLKAAGVVSAVTYQERPPRMEYRLTAKGEDLRPLMREMVYWGVRHAGGRMPPLTCGRCRRLVTPHFSCDGSR